jgi:ribosomal-protein-alanine N-acetyltransferase
VLLRPARDDDRAAISAIQDASPEASSWDPFGYAVTVADLEGRVVGFLVTRRIAHDELEILNLAVAPPMRRKGVARALVQGVLETLEGAAFLEVRESNTGARQFYESIGFTELDRRPGYYSDPHEAAIVMKLRSC